MKSMQNKNWRLGSFPVTNYLRGFQFEGERFCVASGEINAGNGRAEKITVGSSAIKSLKLTVKQMEVIHLVPALP